MATRKVPRISPELNPRRYPRSTRWHQGFVSKAQARKFQRSAKLRDMYYPMLANTPGRTKAQKLNKLPQRIKKKRR